MTELIRKEKERSPAGPKSLAGGVTLLVSLLVVLMLTPGHDKTPLNPETLQQEPELLQAGRPGKQVPEHATERTNENPDDETSHTETLLLSLLGDVQSISLDPEDRISTQAVIKELAATTTGKTLIADAFFEAAQPSMSHIMYNLILDADIKDTALIVALAEREQQESSPAIRQRLIDLISDASTNTALSYSVEINDFLTRAAMDPAPEINQAARIRHAWYTARFSEAPESVLADYLLDSSAEVRGEVYEILQSPGFKHDNGLDPELVLALQSLLEADYLRISPAEQASIQSLLTTSTDSNL